MSKISTIEEIKEEKGTKLIFEDGPTAAKLEEWKTTYKNKVYSLNLTRKDVFIWRPLTRKEFKELNALDVSPLEKEESLCEICVLWPENYTFTEIEDGLAGAPSILAEHIMETSGFNTTSVPTAL